MSWIPRRHAAFFVALSLVYLPANLWISRVDALWGSGLVFAYFGLIYSQFSLMVVWNAVAPGSLVTRFPWVLLCAAAATLTMNVGYRLEGATIGPTSVSSVGLAVLVTVGAAQLTLWTLRCWQHWQLVTHEPFQGEPNQFSVSEMLKGTTILAGVLVCGKLAVGNDERFAVLPVLDGFVAFQVFVHAASHFVLAVACFWLIFQERSPLRIVGWGAAVVLFAALANSYVSGGTDVVGEHVYAEASHFVVLAVFFSALKMTGCRLVKSGPASEPVI